MIKLVKYANRRIYFPVARQFVTARQVLAWVKEGRAVSIRCNRTHLDITKDVLLGVMPQNTQHMDLDSVLVALRGAQ